MWVLQSSIGLCGTSRSGLKLRSLDAASAKCLHVIDSNVQLQLRQSTSHTTLESRTTCDVMSVCMRSVCRAGRILHKSVAPSGRPLQPALCRTYAVQAPGAPRFQVFNRRTKWMQKERAASDVQESRQTDYLKDEVAIRLSERLLVRMLPMGRRPHANCDRILNGTFLAC